MVTSFDSLPGSLPQLLRGSILCSSVCPHPNAELPISLADVEHVPLAVGGVLSKEIDAGVGQEYRPYRASLKLVADTAAP